MKTRLNLLVKLGLVSGTLGTVLIASAAPLAVSNLDAQLISYFRPYAPAAEVLVKKMEKNLPVDKTDATAKSKNKAVNDTQLCIDSEADKNLEAEGLQGKPSDMPKLR
ncbi:MAG: hypothetical protein HYR68_05290 [Burkholderiales bacterium]|nr:hypothetical protein [Burkholderiales bacterium]MBI3730125.1 hypothetical protein [Burkholderiales bacterium]